MTQKERLVDYLAGFPLTDSIKVTGTDCVLISRRDAEDLADKLIDANGVIVPPCNVGDTVYLIMAAYSTLDKSTYFAEPIEGVVDGVWKGMGDRNEIDIRLNSNFGGEIVYRTFEDYKKSFFLDRKEAVAALERILNDG